MENESVVHVSETKQIGHSMNDIHDAPLDSFDIFIKQCMAEQKIPKPPCIDCGAPNAPRTWANNGHHAAICVFCRAKRRGVPPPKWECVCTTNRRDPRECDIENCKQELVYEEAH